MGQIVLPPVVTKEKILYWNTVTPICLRVVYSWFCRETAEFNNCGRVTKPKIFTIWPFTEKVC